VATNKEIEAGAKAIAEDFDLPGGGQKKLARVVEGHLAWFEAVEARGMTWADMTRLLFAAGAKGQNGRPFSVGTLSSTVWRKRDEAKKEAGQNAASRPGEGGNAKWTRPSAKVGTARTATGAQLGQGRRPDRSLSTGALATHPALEKSSKARTQRTDSNSESQPKKNSPRKTNSGSASPASASSKAEAISYMKRAAAIRRSRTDFE
jgi:hypothetical protein